SHFTAKGRRKATLEGIDCATLPVDSVPWDQAVAFCERLSALAEEEKADRVYRLPTEAEGEYACRAGALGYREYHHGDVIDATDVNFDGNHPLEGRKKGPYLRRPAPVGSYRPNAWGLFDMHGNLWEWTADRYNSEY